MQQNSFEVLYDQCGRVVSIVSETGEVQKAFAYDGNGTLVSFVNKGYCLSRFGNIWTDGVQVFDLDIFVNSVGIVTLVDRIELVFTDLNVDGTFVTTVVENDSSYSVHHACGDANRVSQIDYKDGTSRFFRYNQHGMLVRVDECDGFWIKRFGVWNHFSGGRKNHYAASELSLEYNGTLTIAYVTGAYIAITACGGTSAFADVTLAAA